MMKKDRIKEISTHLSVNRTNYMLSFRGNLHEFLNEPDMTVYKLADEANLPYSTLNSLLYGNLTTQSYRPLLRLLEPLESA